jgi:hypothetical protein
VEQVQRVAGAEDGGDAETDVGFEAVKTAVGVLPGSEFGERGCGRSVFEMKREEGAFERT